MWYDDFPKIEQIDNFNKLYIFDAAAKSAYRVSRNRCFAHLKPYLCNFNYFIAHYSPVVQIIFYFWALLSLLAFHRILNTFSCARIFKSMFRHWNSAVRMKSKYCPLRINLFYCRICGKRVNDLIEYIPKNSLYDLHMKVRKKLCREVKHATFLYHSDWKLASF